MSHARTLARGSELAASGLAGRPYGLRHAALIAAERRREPRADLRPAGHSVATLLTGYSRRLHGRDDLLNQQIDQVLDSVSESGPCPSVRSQRVTPTATGGGRRPLYVRNFPPEPPMAHKSRGPQAIPAALPINV
jgi:hypothetical protein